MSQNFSNQLINQLNTYFRNYILVSENILQVAIIIISFIFCPLISKRLKSKSKGLLENLLNKLKLDFYKQGEKLIEILTFPLAFTLLLWIYMLFAINFLWPYQLVNIIAEILTAWIIIRLISSFFNNIFIIRLFSFFILSIVTLNILNIYDRTIKLLDDLALSTGKIRISLLMIIQGIFLLSMFIWLAEKLSSFIEQKIKNTQTLNPSLQVLINKFIKFIIFGLAIIMSLSSLGINLTAFTVLSGAIGVGIGFGLQKIVSNFISGIIILIDKSVKPGDVIEIDNTYGLISNLNSRFVSIVTLNGEEYLIPNEDFITKQVVNLSYSDKFIRLEVPIGISYNSDLEQAIQLVEEAAKNNQRITNIQEPCCFLVGFGSSSVDLKLKFWITDPENGLDNIKSQVLLNIWKKFQEHDIEIPYPQHDLHLQSVANNLNQKDKEPTFIIKSR